MTHQQSHLLVNWYAQHKRDLPWRQTRDPYAIWISEIMLQQTRVEAVKGYYARFLAVLPTVHDLACVDDDRLLKIWEGLGYYSRARNLKKAAQVIVCEHGGQLPRTLAELRSLPGIGDYTAGAIASLAFDVSTPAIDGNVLRVLARLWGDYADVTLPQTRREFAARLQAVMPSDAPGVFNQALMELGALVCIPRGRPLCASCPWHDDCIAHLQDLANELPVKPAKKPRRIEHRQLFILRRGDKVALRRRPPTGLLAGLWELPEAFDLSPALVLHDEDAGSAVHIFTHIEWHMTARKLTLCAPLDDDGLVWVTRDELARDYALPSAFAQFRSALF
ncbi:MAG: A/G-specific adenine glycosylase [Oscillospiraceae bacterium]|nr:A/G-specific adenine glycosylase [Oscillospiraceae bacterium]